MRILFALFFMIPAVALAARPQRIYKLPANESLSITTNEFGQITKVINVTTNGTTKTITFMDNGYKVPIRYRAKWSTLSDAEKLQVMLEANELPQEAPKLYPKKTEMQVTYEEVPSEEIRVIRLRDEEEGE